MKNVAVALACLAFLLVPAAGTAGDLVTADTFIRELGGEKTTREVVVQTRSLSGTKRTIEVRPKQVTIAMQFKYNSVELADERSRLQLTEAGKALSSDKLSGIRVEICGHTDSTGSEQYNRALSLRRAEKIKADLARYYHVAPERMFARGCGETEPVASNETPEGRLKNRRVVITRVQ